MSNREVEMPAWIPDDDDCDEWDYSSAVEVGCCPSSSNWFAELLFPYEQRQSNNQSNTAVSKLDGLPPDGSARILEFLNLQEISAVSEVSKTLYHKTRNQSLWKLKFQARWNFMVSEEGGTIDWHTLYKQAYKNTNDLWITHWNCVHPDDCLAPGRSCIRHPKKKDQNRTKSNKSIGHHHLCPTCRFQNIPKMPATSATIITRAQATAAATSLRVKQHSNLSYTKYSVGRARRAFSKSSTMHRKILTQQYESNSVFALSDLLFFEVHEEDKELEDLKHIFPDTSEYYAHLHESDTALHSWHIARFSNPDFDRPLIWKASVQRQDCFTVYPSEGHLLPGRSQTVIFGIKPFGSLLAHATHQLNAHREGVEQFWASVYTEEAHLPMTPFAIHYHFGLVAPCRSPKDQCRLQQSVRNIYLSAHVTVNYSLNEFRRLTLVPFDVNKPRPDGNIFTYAYCAPQLMVFDQPVWQQLENLTLELEDSISARAYRTEVGCQLCGTSWGERLEELYQAYIMVKIECELDKEKRDVKFRRIHQILTMVVQNLDNHVSLERYLSLCYKLYQKLVGYRGAPWLVRRQQQVLLKWETTLDQIFRVKSEGSGKSLTTLIPWRHAGAYKHFLCSDSVFSSDHVQSVVVTEEILWKEEPVYLKAFRHLTHSPGKFCLGPQEDHNHLRSQDHSKFSRRQKGFATDTFMDSPICSLQSALCLLYDPRSLLVHGVYDHVPYPGTIVRRPRLPCIPPLGVLSCPFEIKLDSFIPTSQKLAYYAIQNSLDMESLWLVDCWCGHRVKSEPLLYPLSLQNFLRNIPPPGTGRFALSTGTGLATELSDSSLDIKELAIEVETFPNHRRSREPLEDEDREEHVGGILLNLPAQRRPHLLSLLLVLSNRLGLTTSDDDVRGAPSVHLERRILIGAHWLSISLMILPLFVTLSARYLKWIPIMPVDYHLESLPYVTENKMRFLTERECGMASLLLLCFLLYLGRWIERFTSRDLFRTMIERMPLTEETSTTFLQMHASQVSHWFLRKYDSVCPLFLQQLVFAPKWNRRDHMDVMKQIAFWNSKDFRECRSFFSASEGHRHDESNLKNCFWGFFVAVCSFFANSPHFSFNMFTIFLCSISAGVSLSLQSLDTSIFNSNLNNTIRQILKSQSFVTIVIFSCLAGQLIGSSGGLMFFAEFVIISISILLGGVGTFSVTSLKSWGLCFCFSSTACLGFLLGQATVLEGLRRKQACFASKLLCASIFITFLLSLVEFVACDWEFPVPLILQRPGLAEKDDLRVKYRTNRLQ